MTCKELIEFLAEYLDGALAPDVKRAFEAHLKVCQACADYLSTYKQTIRVVRATAQRSGCCDPPPIPESLERAIREAAGIDRRP